MVQCIDRGVDKIGTPKTMLQNMYATMCGVVAQSGDGTNTISSSCTVIEFLEEETSSHKHPMANTVVTECNSLPLPMRLRAECVALESLILDGVYQNLKSSAKYSTVYDAI